MQKTTFRVNTKRWGRLVQQCKFIRRDAYLNHVLPREIEILEELPPNSDEAHQFLKYCWFGRLGHLSPDTTGVVSIMLDKLVIENLNAACEDRNVPRDVFFDCVISFLAHRLLEATRVLKNPRTTSDTFWRVAEASRTAGSIKDRKNALLAIGNSSLEIDLDVLRPDRYGKWLHISPAILAGQKMDMEIFEADLARREREVEDPFYSP